MATEIFKRGIHINVLHWQLFAPRHLNNQVQLGALQDFSGLFQARRSGIGCGLSPSSRAIGRQCRRTCPDCLENDRRQSTVIRDGIDDHPSRMKRKSMTVAGWAMDDGLLGVEQIMVVYPAHRRVILMTYERDVAIGCWWHSGLVHRTDNVWVTTQRRCGHFPGVCPAFIMASRGLLIICHR